MKPLLIGILFFSSLLSAQNLVPNPSFENSNYTSAIYNQINYAVGWFSPTNCAGELHDYRYQNFVGTQVARTGICYAGLSLYNFYYPNSNANLREYIAIQLSDSLIAGKKYCVEFYASAAEYSNWRINRIGASLTTSAEISNLSCNPFETEVCAMYPPSQIFTNTEDWIKISGDYYARGGEQFIVIGNFYPDSLTDTIGSNGFNITAYFYIDDVSVVACADEPVLEPVSEIYTSNGFSPNGDGINDVFQVSYSSLQNYSCKIYNRWGGLIYESTDPNAYWDGTYMMSPCLEGVYFYTIEAVGVNEEKIYVSDYLYLKR
jgi:gliding motility-associated-like protein